MSEDRPDLVVPSLGAGVQSTTIALLVCEGLLPRPDVFVFADTGWEPRRVYEHLDRLAAHLAEFDLEVVRVQQGNLREDMLSTESRFTTIPYFILNPEHEVREPATYKPCLACRSTGTVDDGRVDHPADCPACEGTGQVVATWTTRPSTRREREGMGRRQCTSEYKLKPIRRYIRERLGAEPPDYRRVPKGRTAEQWVGFSTDEIHRANTARDNGGVSYLTTRYPLLDLGMSRHDCELFLRERGWDVAKSACIGCPFHGNRQWRELRDNHPDEWADAVAFDERIRHGARGGQADLSLKGEAFLHRSRLPLVEAPIDRVTSREWADRQTDIFGQIAEAQLEQRLEEEGDADGCSPFGCRSGEPVTADE